ncbi:MAG: hypothetical protein KF729_38200 [Sandaracinaceae bacterium]|nr:hypothetical protein [Sandaracinaceae bacterium]
MTTSPWIEIDAVPEAQLPPHLVDRKHGDRVSVIEGGILHVRDGRATFAPFRDLYAVVSHGGRVYLLVPRRPPSPPWLEVDPTMFGADGAAGMARFAERAREGGPDVGGGYRDAVRRHRQGLGHEELLRRVAAREPVPGMMEVPSTVRLNRSYPGLGMVQALAVIGGGFAGYAAIIALAVAAGGGRDGEAALMLGTYTLPFLGLGGGAYAAHTIGRRWRAAADATAPRQRVLVLAPDGCVLGLRDGVRALTWGAVGRFTVARLEPEYEEGLVIHGAEGERVGEIDGGFLDAPLGLVVAVAEAYRDAAASEE